jgi:hypothetical protein
MNTYRQPQHSLLVPSTHAAYFGRTDRIQAFNTWYLKFKNYAAFNYRMINLLAPEFYI